MARGPVKPRRTTAPTLPRASSQKSTSGDGDGLMSSSALGPTPTASQSSIVADEEPTPLDRIFKLFAEQLRDAPGAFRLRRFARTARHIPAPLLADLEELILQVDDPQFVGDDIAIHLIEVSHCDARCADAKSLRSRSKHGCSATSTIRSLLKTRGAV
jgi:hypothetical protein